MDFGAVPACEKTEAGRMTDHGLVENMLDSRTMKIKIRERIKHGSTRVCEKAGGHPPLGQMA